MDPEETGKPESVSQSGVIDVFFMPKRDERLLSMDFYSRSYEGGDEYKYGVDTQGEPLLIEHEAENAIRAPGNNSVFSIMQAAGSSEPGRSRETQHLGRYTRRLRTAVYENNTKPIVDQMVSYLTSNDPHRSADLAEEFKRLDIDKFLHEMILNGLKLTEAWIGFDSTPIPTDVPQTQATAALIDPKNKGKPYLVTVDPRRVVDFTTDMTGCVITRLVYEETVEVKGSFAEPHQEVTYYKEWTATEWIKYELVDEGSAPNTGNELVGDRKVREVERGAHKFGVCPWARFVPAFPIKDLAELNRALFNTMSLHDEELSQSTFTQKWATGISAEALGSAVSGSGNLLHSESDETKFGVFPATPGHAEALRLRAAEIRDAMWAIVGLEPTTQQKNVAEAAEKKRRDLDSLYKSLGSITLEIERIENWLLKAMGLVTDDAADAEKITSYDYDFDVTTLQESIDNVSTTTALPFVPSEFKRNASLMLVKKLDPFGDHEAYEDAIEGMIDTGTDLVDNLVKLKDSGMLTPELFATMIGAPESMRAEMIKHLEGHDAKQEEIDNQQKFDEDGNPIDPKVGADGTVQEDEEGISGGSPPPFGGGGRAA